jgi:methylornithine synthase
MVSPGVIPDNVLARFVECGADWYASYQETHARALFRRLRPGQSFDERMNKKYVAKRFGILVEEGILSGAGESLDDVTSSILVMRALDADQVRVMNLVPQKGTPMENHTPPDIYRELIITSVLRIVFPDKLIPASLDVDGLAGLKLRLDAGANVVTSLVPPGVGLAGVANRCLDIEDGRRTPDSVMTVLNSCGLKSGE